MRIMAATAMIGLLLTMGCSDEFGCFAIIDRGFNLMADISVTHIEPAEFATGSELSLMVVCDCRYTGSGGFTIQGHGGGSDVGTLMAPEETPIGWYSYRLDLPAGRLEIPLTILMTARLDYVAFTISVECDSLLAGDSMVSWDSPEGRAVFQDDVPDNTAFIYNSVSARVTIHRVPSP